MIPYLNCASYPGRMPKHYEDNGGIIRTIAYYEPMARAFGKFAIHMPTGHSVMNGQPLMRADKWHEWTEKEINELIIACNWLVDRDIDLSLYIGGPIGLKPLQGETSEAWAERYLTDITPYLLCNPSALGIDLSGFRGTDYESTKYGWTKEHSEVVFGPDGGWAKVIERLVDRVTVYLEPETPEDSPLAFRRCGAWLMERRLRLLESRDFVLGGIRYIKPRSMCGQARLFCNDAEFRNLTDDEKLARIAEYEAAGYEATVPVKTVPNWLSYVGQGD